MKGLLKISIITVFSILLLFNTYKLRAQTNYLSIPVSLYADSLTIEQSLSQLAKQCHCYFTYDANLISESQKTNIQLNQYPLAKALDTLLANPALHYQVVGNQIVIQLVKVKSKAVDTVHLKDQFISIKGKVLDNSNKLPLSFATVSLKNMNLGAIANDNGDFTIKIPNQYALDTLVFSFVGYFLKEYSIASFPLDGMIQLTPCFVPINEVVVRSNSPSGIIQKAIENIDKNYYTKEYSYQAFYRESVKKSTQVKIYSEAILAGYKPFLTNNGILDKVELIKGRKFTNINNSDTVSVKLKAGIETCFKLDLVHQPTDFLSMDGISLYNYHVDDITLYNNSLVYIIGFSPKQGLDGLFEGQIFVDIASFAIIKVEFRFDQKKFSKAQNMFVMRKSRKINIKPIDTYYVVNYTNWNGKYYASHVRGEFTFKVKKQRKLINEKYCTTLEMAISGYDTLDIKKPRSRDLFTTNTILSENQLINDEGFWEDLNIIVPEKEIKNEISKAGFKLQSKEE